mgnify:CR=1 FL=1
MLLPDKCSIREGNRDCVDPPEYVIEVVSNDGEFMEVGRDFNQNVADISEASQAILDAAGGQHWQMYSIQDGVERHECGEMV